jgi:hypothetical protein
VAPGIDMENCGLDFGSVFQQLVQDADGLSGAALEQGDEQVDLAVAVGNMMVASEAIRE